MTGVDLAGLPPGKRYRCGACGNLTRFDIELSERVRRFWHADLGGAGAAEHEERLDISVDSVACRWCGATDAIEIIDAVAAVEPMNPPPSGEPE